MDLCVHLLPRGQCVDCKHRGEIVYVTDGGTAYHATPQCSALLAGQDDVLARGGKLGKLRVVSPIEALAGGRRRPCYTCRPAPSHTTKPGYRVQVAPHLGAIAQPHEPFHPPRHTNSCTRGGGRFRTIMDYDLVTMKDAADILRVSWQRVQQLAREGKLTPVNATGFGHFRVLFHRGDVERLRAERGVGRYGRG